MGLQSKKGLHMVKTMDLQGKQYATVPERLKEFRQLHNRALIETKHTVNEDGSVIFSTRILTDKSDENSAESTGTAMYTAKEMQKPKAFEKLETVSVGRALALLGYLNNGQIATSEEMNEFNAYQDEKIEEAVDLLKSANDIEELKEIFMGLGSLIAHSKVIAAKDKRKEELQDASN